MAVRTSAGSSLGVSVAAPATFDAAGYGGATFVNIGEIVDLGEFGRVYALVTHNPIDTRATVKRKGSYNEGTLALKLGLDNEDAGQVIMYDASSSDDDHYFKLEIQNGDIYYFPAQVMEFKVGVGGVDTITGASVSLELTSATGGVGIVRVLAP